MLQYSFLHFTFTFEEKLMSLKILVLTLTMSLISITAFLIVLLLETTKAEVKDQVPRPTPSIQNFKEFVGHVIKDQSSKIQTLMKKIQTNAQTVLEKIENIKQHTKINKRKLDLGSKIAVEGHQIESPALKNNEVVDTALEAISEARNYNHYGSSGYGTSGGSNYGTQHGHGYSNSHGHGMPSYHHHSIGFDPINIVVSMSLLSFILQALQGLLGTTTRLVRRPTPVEEARSLQQVQDWTKKIEENLAVKDKDKYYLQKKLPKKYYSN